MAGERLASALKVFRKRYQAAAGSRKERGQVLREFCSVTKYHPKYAIALLRVPADVPKVSGRRRRGASYSAASLRVVEAIWKAAGYPWSHRLKALLPLWMPWAHKHIKGISPAIEQAVLRISARQIDRRLKEKKRQLKRRLYGRTKPGTLLKHHIPVKTDCWDVTEPGFAEIDLVAHCGPSATGEFIHSLNLTDIHTGWVETRAILGKSEGHVVQALDEIRRQLPYTLKGLDSDNGSEFINYHLYRYCQKHQIKFTRGRPYKKNDNAHIEQKNWTHVRRIFGWERLDTQEHQKRMNEVYAKELRQMMNLYQPSVKLISKHRVGSVLRRQYDQAMTPLDRLLKSYSEHETPLPLQRLELLRERLDPFELEKTIEAKLESITRTHKNDKNAVALAQ